MVVLYVSGDTTLMSSAGIVGRTMLVIRSWKGGRTIMSQSFLASGVIETGIGII